MLNSSNIIAIEGKFKRNKEILNNTFLFKKNPINILNSLDNDEHCILYYIDSTVNCWFLTNKNLVLPNMNFNINLSLLKNVDFINIKENPSEKLINKEIDLFTEDRRITLAVEEKSWPLIYSIFKFIINKNL